MILWLSSMNMLISPSVFISFGASWHGPITSLYNDNFEILTFHPTKKTNRPASAKGGKTVTGAFWRWLQCLGQSGKGVYLLLIACPSHVKREVGLNFLCRTWSSVFKGWWAEERQFKKQLHLSLVSLLGIQR